MTIRRYALALTSTLLAQGACNCEGATLNQRKPPNLVLTPASVAFGSVPVTFSATQDVQVKNTGEEDLKIDTVQATGSPWFTVSAAPPKVASQETATLKVTFLPLAVEPATATFTVVSNADNGHELAFTATGNGSEPYTCGSCNAPPPPQCLSASESLQYDPTGTCDNGQCRYTARRTTCPGYCEISTGLCTGAADAGQPVDAGFDAGFDAGPPDAGTPDAGPCNPDGTYTLAGGNVTYTCCFGLVNLNFNRLTLASHGASVSGSPSMPSMNGAGASCPAGTVSAQNVKAGGCTETYTLNGTFSSTTTFAGHYTVTFTGNDCGCFSGLGTVCTDQDFPVTATR